MQKPDFGDLPQRVDRKAGAALLTFHFFPIAARTLEKWPIAWRMLNGRATCRTRELFAVAKAKVDAAPTLPSIRRSTASAQGDAT